MFIRFHVSKLQETQKWSYILQTVPWINKAKHKKAKTFTVMKVIDICSFSKYYEVSHDYGDGISLCSFLNKVVMSCIMNKDPVFYFKQMYFKVFRLDSLQMVNTLN